MNRLSQYGFTLIELVVASAVGVALLLGLIATALMLGDVVKNTENKSVFLGLGNDLEALLRNELQCASVLRANPSTPGGLIFSPPSDINAAYGIDIPYLVMGSEILASGPATAANDPKARFFQTKRLQLIRVPGTQVFSGPATYGSPPVTLPLTNTYVARLELDVQRTGGTLDNQQMSRTWVMNVTTDPGGRIVKCQSGEAQVRPMVAVGRRTALAFSRRNCRQSIPDDHWKANACADVSAADGRCDSDPDLAVDAHPSVGQPIWDNSFPTRQTGTNVLAPQEEGRCLFSQRLNQSLESPDRIFVLKNRPYPEAEGIGCNRANGWNLVSCLRGDNGLGDSDTDFIVDPLTGNQFCVTNDHTQPHLKSAWAIKNVQITAVCQKFEQ